MGTFVTLGGRCLASWSSSVFHIPHGHRPPSAACLGSQPWMAEEIMKPLLHLGSFRVDLLF